MASDRPNLICIIIDTARRDRLGCYGYPRGLTPAIDQLARESLVFEKMITPGPWTIPSHGSLLTGLYPREHGAHYPTPILRRDAVTLPAHLARAGYATCCVSNNGLLGRSSNLTQGFDRVLRRRDYDIRSRRLRRVRDGLGLPDSGGSAANRRISILLRELPRPFFLFINYMECHWPYAPSPAVERRFARARTAPWTSIARRWRMLRRTTWAVAAEADERDWQILHDLYDGEVATVDAKVGELLEVVQTQQLDGETVVLLTSDHGEHLGEHGLIDHQGSLYQTLIHVPFVARIPGVGGTRITDMAEFTDVFPGVCRALGVAPPPHLEGRWEGADLFASRSAADHGARRQYAFAEWHPWGSARLQTLRREGGAFDFRGMEERLEAVQDGRYKLIAAPETGQTRLFDLEEDPGESRDLALERPGEAYRLSAALDRWRSEFPEAGGAYTKEDEEAVERRLRELGYV